MEVWRPDGSRSLGEWQSFQEPFCLHRISPTMSTPSREIQLSPDSAQGRTETGAPHVSKTRRPTCPDAWLPTHPTRLRLAGRRAKSQTLGFTRRLPQRQRLDGLIRRHTRLPGASPRDLHASPCDLVAQNGLRTTILSFCLNNRAAFRPLASVPAHSPESPV
jgi:hypothetical protein